MYPFIWLQGLFQGGSQYLAYDAVNFCWETGLVVSVYPLLVNWLMLISIYLFHCSELFIRVGSIQTSWFVILNIGSVVIHITSRSVASVKTSNANLMLLQMSVNNSNNDTYFEELYQIWGIFLKKIYMAKGICAMKTWCRHVYLSMD